MSDSLEGIFGGRAADFIADGWDTEGLPSHLVDNVPVTVEVTTFSPGREPKVENCEIFTLDGEQITHGNRRRGWTAGEREGWLER